MVALLAFGGVLAGSAGGQAPIYWIQVDERKEGRWEGKSEEELINQTGGQCRVLCGPTRQEGNQPAAQHSTSQAGPAAAQHTDCLAGRATNPTSLPHLTSAQPRALFI